jgi:hypothetical protein
VSPLRSRAPEALTQAGLAALMAPLLLAVGQPLFTDDSWWHLALGREFARAGPRLAADPLLFTAPGPPEPVSWLFDLGLYEIVELAGFAGLRVVHLLLVVAILCLAWSLLRRASGSRTAASLLTGGFVVLSAYRLVQLRPHLVTMLATLILYRLLVEGGAVPTKRRIAFAAMLLAFWINVHAGFLLGLVVIGAALGGSLVAIPSRSETRRRTERSRAIGLAVALVLTAAATLMNPSGVESHLAYFSAGVDTPALSRVGDEWAPIELFRFPVASLPPSPLAWSLIWVLVVGSVVACASALRGWRRETKPDPAPAIDPALVSLTLVSLVAMWIAVRFSWLAIFPLLLLAESGRRTTWFRATRFRGSSRPLHWAAAAAALLMLPGFLRFGIWPAITTTLPSSLAGYAQPYTAAKYHSHAVWVLADAGLEGNLFNEYFMGGFLGYWLAPQLRCFVNGTLNVEAAAIDANLPIRERRGALPGESFLELLDRQRIDVFFGIRQPQVGAPNRPWFYTTAYLEGSPGWIRIFRNQRSALYLRANARNDANLKRIDEYYAREGVPFDPRDGFDPERVLRERSSWAIAHGLVPVEFQRLVGATRAHDTSRRQGALDRLSSVYAALGVYDRAAGIDRQLLEEEPRALRPRRRLVWSMLRLGRATEAAEAAGPLARAGDPLSRAITGAAAHAVSHPTDDPVTWSARLPVFTNAEAWRLLAGQLLPPARTRRP